MTGSRAAAVLGTALFTVLVPGMIAGVVPLLLAEPAPVSHALRAVGWLLIGLGTLLYLWCATGFAWGGRGTPAPVAAPRTLVVGGPYHWSRNPMYVAVLAVVLGQAARLGSRAVLAYAVLLWTLFSIFIRLYEEPRLAARFGDAYAAYRRRVPRWLGRRA